MIVFDLCDHTGLSFLIQEHIALPQGKTESFCHHFLRFNSPQSKHGDMKKLLGTSAYHKETFFRCQYYAMALEASDSLY